MKSSRVAVVLLAGMLGSLGFAAPSPARAAHLVFGACSPAEAQAMVRAFAQAASDAAKGVKAAAATTATSSDPAFVEWFGAPSASNVPKVLATLTATQQYIGSSHALNVLCASDDDACDASIAPDVGTRFGDALTVCKSFFQLPVQGETSQSVALLRELTFLAGSTNDDTPSAASAKALAKGNPPTALQSAANFAYYSALGYTP